MKYFNQVVLEGCNAGSLKGLIYEAVQTSFLLRLDVTFHFNGTDITVNSDTDMVVGWHTVNALSSTNNKLDLRG